MKKTLSIQLGGIVFQIEDDAYHALHKYIEGLKSKFHNDPDQKEIIEDIEQRIAEIFQQEMSEPNEAVTLIMVENAIATLGTASDIADEEEPEEKKQTNAKRLYRDKEKAVFGGVCAGLSSYIRIDLTVLRIIFVILLIASSGIPFFVVYLVLWVAIPEAKTTTQRMEMKGEPVNIDSIEKTVKDKSKKPPQKERQKKSGDSAGETILKLFAWIIIGFFLLIVLSITITLLAALFGLTVATSVLGGILPELFVQGHFLNIHPDLLSNTTHSILGLILFIGAPVILILFVISKLAFKHNGKVGWVLFVSTALWLLGIGLLASSSLRVIEKAANMDIEFLGEDNDGVVVIGGDTIFAYTEDYDDKFRLRLKTRNGKLDVDERKNKISFTSNLGAEDTMIIAQPTNTYKNRDNKDEYEWITPEYKIISADIEKVAIGVDLDDYSYNFNKFTLEDPAFMWERNGSRLILPNKIGFKKNRHHPEKLPVIFIKVPNEMTLLFENDSDNLFINLSEEQKERIENGKYYRLKESVFYLAN